MLKSTSEAPLLQPFTIVKTCNLPKECENLVHQFASTLRVERDPGQLETRS